MEMNLPFLPQRTPKPRFSGITMVMDKGLSTGEAVNFLENCAPYTDLVKLGFGTSVFSSNVEKKVELYRNAGVRVYFGGTLFEAFVIRNMFEDYVKIAKNLKLDTVEVSDGSMFLPHSKKLEYISRLAKDFTVLSEVGSKAKGVEIPDEIWVEMMEAELKAGAWKVIAEARESGTTGIYHSDGSVNDELIRGIKEKLNTEDVLWEAPTVKQQSWFIKLLGPNVNLGNIAVGDVVALESLRQGLRGDTFLDYLPADLKSQKPASEKYKSLQ